MSVPTFDPYGTARLSVAEVLRDFGSAALDDETRMASLLPDLLADAPREARLVRTAAAMKVGGLLGERVHRHGMPVMAAIEDIASRMSQANVMDIQGCRWVVGEYAIALGFLVPVAQPPAGYPPTVPVPPPPGPPRWSPPPASPPMSPYPAPASPGVPAAQGPATPATSPGTAAPAPRGVAKPPTAATPPASTSPEVLISPPASAQPATVAALPAAEASSGDGASTVSPDVPAPADAGAVTLPPDTRAAPDAGASPGVPALPDAPAGSPGTSGPVDASAAPPDTSAGAASPDAVVSPDVSADGTTASPDSPAEPDGAVPTAATEPPHASAPVVADASATAEPAAPEDTATVAGAAATAASDAPATPSTSARARGTAKPRTAATARVPSRAADAVATQHDVPVPTALGSPSGVPAPEVISPATPWPATTSPGTVSPGTLPPGVPAAGISGPAAAAGPITSLGGTASGSAPAGVAAPYVPAPGPVPPVEMTRADVSPDAAMSPWQSVVTSPPVTALPAPGKAAAGRPRARWGGASLAAAFIPPVAAAVAVFGLHAVWSGTTNDWVFVALLWLLFVAPLTLAVGVLGLTHTGGRRNVFGLLWYLLTPAALTVGVPLFFVKAWDTGAHDVKLFGDPNAAEWALVFAVSVGLLCHGWLKRQGIVGRLTPLSLAVPAVAFVAFLKWRPFALLRDADLVASQYTSDGSLWRTLEAVAVAVPVAVVLVALIARGLRGRLEPDAGEPGG